MVNLKINKKFNGDTSIRNGIAKIGISHGFEWGGNWTNIIDKPHFQMNFGLSIQDLQNGIKP